jgi:hypothetical protein
LPAALRVNARATWQFAPAAAVYIAADNLFDEDIATTMAADGIVNYDAPRMVRIGLSYSM